MSTILITGANRGIGLEFVKQYAGEGARIHACCRNPDKAEALRAVKGDVVVHALDVSDFAAIKALGVKIDEPLDIVIANAGVAGFDSGEMGDLNFSTFASVMTINAVSPIATLEAFAPQLKRAKGKFAAISSILSSFAVNMAFDPSYCASKAALNRALLAFAPSFVNDGIAIGPFHPGWVRTDMGGPQADVAVEDSVSGLRKQIAKMRVDAPIRLIDYQGKEIGW